MIAVAGVRADPLLLSVTRAWLPSRARDTDPGRLDRYVAGGQDPDSSAYRGLFDAPLSVDAGRAFDWEGGHLTLGLQASGESGSGEVGVVQNYSNVDAADDRVQLARRAARARARAETAPREAQAIAEMRRED